MDSVAVDPIASTVPEFIAKAIPLILGASVLCRGASEVLLLVASRFRSAEAGKAAAKLAKAADVAARIVGWFGGGMPKTLVMDRAEKITMKGLGVDASKGTKS